MKKIIVSIDKVGRPTIDAQGFVGGACKEKTSALIRAFTNGKESEVKVVEKDELYMTEDNAQHEHLHN
jgi:hypothetical protein